MTPSPEQLGLWVLCAVLFIDVALRIGTYYEARKPKSTSVAPQPLVVRGETEYARASDMCNLEETVAANHADAVEGRRGLHAKLDEIRKEMAEMERRIDDKQEKRIENVHRRVNEVLTAVSNLAGQLDAARKRP